MAKIIVFLSTAFNVSNVNDIPVQKGIHRDEQYFLGIKKFFEFNFKKYSKKINFLLSDNTICENVEINKKIFDLIPNFVNLDFKFENESGSKNKGAGILQSWTRNKEEILKYDYLLHFEPRLILINYDFIENFLKNPRTIFTIPESKDHFNTGLFSIKTKNLIDFLESTSPQYIVENNISIEYFIFDFFKNNNISYDLLDKMNVIWHDSNKDVSFNM